MILDLYEAYCNIFSIYRIENQTFKLKDIYKVGIKLFTYMNDSNIKSLYDKLNSYKVKDYYLSKLIEKNKIKMFKTKREFIRYYKGSLKKYTNKVIGLDDGVFLK